MVTLTSLPLVWAAGRPYRGARVRTSMVAFLVALRQGGVDVLDFKASIDELSRLSASRAEDEQLLLQLEAKLPHLDQALHPNQAHFPMHSTPALIWMHASFTIVISDLVLQPLP